MMKKDLHSDLKQQKFPAEAYLLLFGNNHCSVCEPVKSKIEIALKDLSEIINFIYIDTLENQELAASLSIFTNPVIIFSFQGKEYHRWVRNFSINEILNVVHRILQLSKN